MATITESDHSGNPFAVEGRWYRGNLHGHSTNSMDVPEDRGKSPADVVAWYRDHGYDFVGITDHRVLTDTSAFATADFVTINSIETHNWDARGVLFDIVGVGVHSFTPSSEDCHPLPAPGGSGGPQGAIDRINADGGIAIMVHPTGTGLGVGDLRQFQGFVGIEIYNAANDDLFSKGYATIQWDEFSLASLEGFDAHRNLTWGFAADDVHYFAPNEAGRGWVMVRTTDFSVPGLLTAMRAGHFYASQGPEIHDVQIAGGKVTVECSPVRRISVMARRNRGRTYRAAGDDVLTGIEHELRHAVPGTDPERQELYVRIEVEDAEGRHAWTNPQAL